MTTVAPFGSWRSPITAELLVEQAVRLASVEVSGDDVYWLEGRPSEGGRQAIVRRGPDGATSEVLPTAFSARTLVHEYGGRSYVVSGTRVYFSNFADQRLYRVELGGEPVPVTPAPAAPQSVRFADPVVTPDGEWLICVRESHGEGEAVNDLVAIRATGGEPVSLASGHDFFAAPRLSPDGSSLAWLTWDHPNMPWDGTELWVAPISGCELSGTPTLVAGGPRESVSQPRWSPEGTLHYASDRTGWWNLYDADGRALCTRDAEFSGPDWVFGQSTYAFLPDGTLVAGWSDAEGGHLGVVVDGAVSPIALPYTSFGSVQAVDGGVVAIAGSPTEGPAVVRIAVPSGIATHAAGRVEVLKRGRERSVDAAYLSVPEPIEFPTTGDRTAHAFFYPPHNADFGPPEGELPPLIVMSHGGPTSATSAVLDLGLQFWTSRGFGVVDVNYGGSTGYGREYRERLRGMWGVVDVDDCIAAAEWLAGEGRVDGDRMVIRGGSAGGYTTLAALTFRDVFAAGASHFGVADLEALATDTHKFESRYLDGLVGPYPASRDIYVERSPIHHTDRLSRPMILFQGLEDKVVPPEQAEMMAGALREKGIPFAYLSFEGEQHGFRAAETIKRVAEAELSFYGRVLGFVPAGEIAPVRIENEEALPS